MRTISCLFIGLLAFTDRATTRCGVHFQAPDGWTVTRRIDKELKDCSVGLKPADWDAQRRRSEIQTTEYALYLTVSRRSMDDVALVAGFARIGFLRDELELPERFVDLADDDWLIAGKGYHPTTRIHGKDTERSDWGYQRSDKNEGRPAFSFVHRIPFTLH
jgi:hypothetical protein